ncbi:MAG: MBL fold metallo-hydrolase [Thermoplasmata archaeon]|nr:MAG: MBL fold metallo-hydrolase [Thermoplasmata archaeon]
MQALNGDEKGYNIILEWFGHSCFTIDINGIYLYLDPVRKNPLICTTLEPRKNMNANAILVSHEHWDHFDAETILALGSSQTKIFCPNPVANSLEHRLTFEASNLKELKNLSVRIKPLKSEDVIQLDVLKIKCLEASEGLSFLIFFRDYKILFMGDSVATDEMIKEKPDVILFPVWAVKGEEAKLKEFLELAKESLCIPMHYHTSQDALPNFYIESEELFRLLPKNIRIEVIERNIPFQI